MSQSTVWVLIAGDQDAAIWTSENGASRLLRQVRRMDNDESRAAFAWQLIGELTQGALAKSCDGVIVIAEEEMLREIRRVIVPEIKRLMLAEIPGTPATISAISREQVTLTAWGTMQ